MVVRVLRVIENKIATKNCFNQKPPNHPVLLISETHGMYLTLSMSDAYVYTIFKHNFVLGIIKAL